MVERSAKMVFAAGAIVFPGGRVDDNDREFAQSLGFLLDENADNENHVRAAAKIAAIRETLEETGIAIGFATQPSAKLQSEMRAALDEGALFSEICAQNGLTLKLDALTPWTRWRPPFHERRIFDTRFFIVRDDHPEQSAVVDATENKMLFWGNASDILEMTQNGKVKAIFPTMRNLERLALFKTYDQILANAQSHEARLIVPNLVKRGDKKYLTIPENLGFPVTEEEMTSVRRG